MSRIKARRSRSNKPHKGTKHPGIYGKHRDICPTPMVSYVQMNWNIPTSYAVVLQEIYPDLSLNLAVKQFVLDNIEPKDIKEI